MAMTVIVVGGGKVGAYLTTLLLSAGHRVRIVEAETGAAARLRNEFPEGVLAAGSGTDPDILEAAGVRRADVVAAMTGTDEENLVVTSLARFEFGVTRTIARINDPRNAWMFTPAMGVDVALNQADLLAHLIAEEMSLGDMMLLLKLRKGRFALVEEKVDPEARASGTALRDLRLPSECAVAGVIRKGRLLLPEGDLVLQPADEVLAVVHTSRMADLAALLGRPT